MKVHQLRHGTRKPRAKGLECTKSLFCFDVSSVKEGLREEIVLFDRPSTISQAPFPFLRTIWPLSRVTAAISQNVAEHVFGPKVIHITSSSEKRKQTNRCQKNVLLKETNIWKYLPELTSKTVSDAFVRKRPGTDEGFIGLSHALHSDHNFIQNRIR